MSHHVLVVDDSPSQREMIATLLRTIGMQVTVAGNGEEALECLKSLHPDLVITDVVMPKMNGYEFCRNLKKNPATESIPVLMCTSKGEEFDRYWGMKQGADAYIAKPFKPNDLNQAIQKLLAAP
ncbi:response regulator [Oscillatoria sp. FACHB-1406]|uniref:response regulator n=1 Tax=Oscillatoria sp. FACHB-1406 TaxID=2692846 RepID=UPI001685E324|nr:response regulator [Oscillatoria sp. FACHB-1406]MBD2578813.1 response regulator [Oscillatoria sp. FACHB-1406]